MHDINIIIVNYKSKDEILRCLRSLFADLIGNNLDIHITIVDNASVDSVDLAVLNQHPDAKLKIIKHKKNLGFGKAQNSGMAGVEAKYHFVLNPDTFFPEQRGVLEKLYNFMEINDKVGIVAPKIIHPDGILQNSCYRFPRFLQPIYSRTKLGEIGQGKKTADYYFMRDFDHNETIPVDWVMGAAMFVRQKAIDEVGLFDERFWMYAEDSDWCRRMWENGWMVFYLHDAVIHHEHKRDSARVRGVFRALIKNKLARVHIVSWLKYMWKWRKTHRFYV